MHIAIANQWFPPEGGWGGVSVYNYAIANSLVALGHRVTIVTSNRFPELAPVEERHGICIRRLLVRDTPRLRRLPGLGKQIRTFQMLSYSWRVDKVLGRLHREEGVDLVEFAEVNAEGFFYAQNPQTPVVVRCHTPTRTLLETYDRRELGFDPQLIAWCEGVVIRRASTVTAPSRYTADSVSAAFGLGRERVSVIPNPVPVYRNGENAALPELGTALQVLHVGRLDRAKGVVALTLAIPRVRSRLPGTRFVFAGNDCHGLRGESLKGEMQEWLKETGAAQDVTFLGKVEHSDLEQVYLRADMCVVPSLLAESFSYTCAEAMAAGKPVVASHVGGIPETVDDGITGLLVAPGDEVALADAIVSLGSNPNLREKMGRAGRDKVIREFDPVKIAQRTVDVYRTVVA